MTELNDFVMISYASTEPYSKSQLVVISLDFGTSGCKGCLVDLEGRIISSVKMDYKTYFGPGNIVEQNPFDWIKTAMRCLKILCKRNYVKRDIIGLCVDATVGTLVPIEKWGMAAIDRVPLYSDMRALKEIEIIREKFGESYIYKRTGNPLTPVPTIVKMMWYKRHKPKIYEKTKKFIFHKDFIVENFIDENDPFTDYTDASATMAFDISKKEWIYEVFEEVKISEEKMAEVKESTEIVGELKSDIARKLGINKVPVIVGAGDCAVTLYGAGAIRDDTGDIYLGTAPEIDLTLEELRLDPKFRIPVRCHSLKNQWYSSATTLSGYSINWFLDKIVRCVKTKYSQNVMEFLNRECKKIPASSKGLLYLPYIIGERSPLCDPLARAAFIGLDMNHGVGHMYRAILEGISFALRENYEVYINDMKIKIGYLAFCGGGAQNTFLRKMITSNLKVNGIVLKNSIDCAALGSAMLFFKSIGLYKDLKKAKNMMVKIIRKEKPDKNLIKIYDKYYSIYKEAYAKLKNLFVKIKKYRD